MIEKSGANGKLRAPYDLPWCALLLLVIDRLASPTRIHIPPLRPVPLFLRCQSVLGTRRGYHNRYFPSETAAGPGVRGEGKGVLHIDDLCL